jgi:hypothetical protein
MDECKFDEKVCEAIHRSIDARLSIYSWVFGIIITTQLAMATFTGWLATRVTAIEVFNGSIGAKLESIDRIQQQVLVKLEKNSDKLDALADNWAKHTAKDIK